MSCRRCSGLVYQSLRNRRLSRCDAAQDGETGVERIDDPTDKRRMFFWRNYLSNIGFDYVICSK